MSTASAAAKIAIKKIKGRQKAERDLFLLCLRTVSCRVMPCKLDGCDDDGGLIDAHSTVEAARELMPFVKKELKRIDEESKFELSELKQQVAESDNDTK